MKQHKRRELLWMLLPVLLLGTLALTSGRNSSGPPVLEKIEVGPLRPGDPRGSGTMTMNSGNSIETVTQRHYDINSSIRVYIRYRAPRFYTRWWGWQQDEAIRWGGENQRFLDQNGKTLSLTTMSNGLVYEGNDLYCIVRTFDSNEIPRSAGRTTWRIRGVATDAGGNPHVLTGSTVVREGNNRDERAPSGQEGMRDEGWHP